MQTFFSGTRAPIPESHQRTRSVPTRVRLLLWWYRHTSPPDPGEDASFRQREVFRRGRTGSQISFFLFLLLASSLPAAVAGSNPLLVVILVLNAIFLAVAMLLNRLQRVTLAGIIAVLGVVLGPVVNILTTPGGITTSTLPLFGFLVLPLVCAVSFLPPSWVFVVAAGTSLFTLVALRVLPSSGEVQMVVQPAFAGLVTPILLSQWMVALVASLWVRGAQRAILRADRAEDIGKLEHALRLMEEEKTQQHERLELSISLIVQVLVQVANGAWDARIPLIKENSLWHISGTVNNLLARLQQLRLEVSRFHQLQAELYRVREDNARLRTALHHAHAETTRLKEQLEGKQPSSSTSRSGR